MGATNCPETPRQRMIGMMYLVLTAMLALNVSKDILDAFVVVDETLVKTNENFERKVEATYAQFAAANISQPAKAGPYYKKALEVKDLSKKMVEYIYQVRAELISKAEGKTIDEVKDFSVKQIEAKDNKDIPHNYFLVKEKKGEELRIKIEEFRTKLLSFVKADKKADFEKKIGLDTKGPFQNADGENQTWEDHNFGETILAASVTLLNKIVGEVKNAEFDILSYLMVSITSDGFAFDDVSARVIPTSKLVFSGSNFEADIIVAAFDSRSTPEVFYKMGIDTATEAMIPSMTKVEGADGICKLQIPASGMGEQKFAGLIKMKKADGTAKFYSFKESYSVAKSQATVAAEKMNVLYADIDNPVSVSAPVPPDKIRINGGGLVFKGSAGKYIVTPPSSMIGKKVTVTASADFGGKSQSLGGTEFRIMKIPAPIPKVGGTYGGGSVSASIISGSPFIMATTPDGFAFDLKYRITGFKMLVGRKDENPKVASSGNFSNDMINAIKRAESGEPMVIYDITVSATVDGKPVSVANKPQNITIRLK